MNLLGILIVALLAQQPGPASIEGVVVRAGTSQPIARAVVQLSGTSLSEPLAMATGVDGKFEFQNIAPGPYRLTVSRSGYLDSAYRQGGLSRTGAALAMEAGQTRKNIHLAMIASGAISGRVHDSNGEPAANVRVLALKYSYQDGQRTLTTVKTDQTDDRGEYRLFWLPPGRYYVSATPLGARSADLFSVSPDGDDRGRSAAEKKGETDVPIYYPGTADAQAAAPVEVRPGADIGGVDFMLTDVKTRKVRGTVVDGLTGQPAASAAVALVPRNPSPTGFLNGRPATGGAFEIQNVLPGSYFLVATYWRTVGGAVRMMGGRIPLEVGGSDVDGVAMIVSPALDVAGGITVEGRNDDANDNHPSVTLKNEVRSVPGRPPIALAQFSTSKQFEIHDVIEGDYQVQVSDLPPGTYVKSIRFGATDVLKGSLHIDPRTSDRVEIVLSANAAVLDGTVLDENRKPVANAPVALVPDAVHRQRADLYRSAWTDEFGRFHLQTIPPGDYFLFAGEGMEETLWRDPEFLSRNEAAGKTIRITGGGHENVELTAMRTQ